MKSGFPAMLLLAAALGSSCSPRLRVVPVTAAQVLSLTRGQGARATLVNVWATWCAPCREEFPSLLRAAAARRSLGLRLVLVSADFEDQLPAVRDFLRAQGVSGTTYIESGDPMAFINAMNPAWSGALPATFVYDAGGRRVAFWEGAADSTHFTEAADRALSPHATDKETVP